MSDRPSLRLQAFFHWWPELLKFGQQRLRSQVRMMALAVIVGLVAGLGAVGFYVATNGAEHYALKVLAGYSPEPAPAGESKLDWPGTLHAPFRPWLLVVICTVGGLLSGLLVYTIAPEAEGHGTDSVIEAYHLRNGDIRLRVPIVKIIASALTIGSGGSGGREGPIAQIGAGFASFMSRMLNLRPIERRILVAAGMGAGIAAIFRAPLAGALFAAEVLYWSPEFEPEVIIPAGIASVVSYCTFGSVFGWTPLFEVPQMAFAHPAELIPYTVLALLMVVLAMTYTRTFYGLTHLFARLPVPKIFRPAIGAFLTAMIGLAMFYAFGQQKLALAVMSFGYNALQDTLYEPTNSSMVLLLTIGVVKILTTSLTIGSGGSGGVFGPSMVIGGCAGGAFGLLLQSYWPEIAPHPASFAIIGMAGFFSAAAKTPFSTLIMVCEMTNGYTLLLPALWVCVVSFVLSDQQSIYHCQVESRSRSPAHRGAFVRELLGSLIVSQFMIREQVPKLRLADNFAVVALELDVTQYPLIPVVDDADQLQGAVNLEDAYIATRAADAQPYTLAADVMRTDIVPLLAEDSIEQAMELFAEFDVLALPVVDAHASRKLIGIVRRSQLASALVKQLQGEKLGMGNSE